MMATTLANQEDYAVGIEEPPNDQIDRRLRPGVRPPEKTGDPVIDDVLDVACADSGLLHGGRVDVELDVGMAPRAQVGFESRRDDDDEHEPALVHRGFDLGDGDQLRQLEARRIEGVHQFLGQGRAILVDKGDRGVVDFARSARCLNVDRPSECIDDKQNHHQIAREAAELLEAEPKMFRR